MGWDVDGVTGESRYIKLLYSEAAAVVLAQFERELDDGQTVGSLYVRGRDETEYRKAFVGDESASVRHVVCSPRSAIAVFSVWCRGDVRHIGRLDLTTGQVTVALDMKMFRKKHERGWVHDLIDSSDDASTVLCRTTSWRPSPTEEHPGRLHVDYWLSRVELDTGAIERITLLRNIGF